ncbi:hypothetical protein HPB50_015437 [Hyalomma asiaticum]|uniref:Uncharacterized protein n=1 Tax=Hyalomma asiaticum TaxID=266040 RepID=A0ACB7TN97_HYAAI|nr:hypothetical protein HPB50_015437 [Hyalomma asiaticum]
MIRNLRQRDARAEEEKEEKQAVLARREIRAACAYATQLGRSSSSSSNSGSSRERRSDAQASPNAGARPVFGAYRGSVPGVAERERGSLAFLCPGCRARGSPRRQRPPRSSSAGGEHTTDPIKTAVTATRASAFSVSSGARSASDGPQR